MELKRRLRKVAASALALTMGASIGLSAVGCGLDGQLKLEEFVANSISMDTEYFVGEEINFKGLVLQAKYNDDSTKDVAVSDVTVKLNGQDVTNKLSEITATAGEKTVELVFEGKSVTIKIVVSEVSGGGDSTGGEDGGNEEAPKYNVAMYTLPQSIVDRTKKINNAGQEYGSDKYESSFYQAEDKEVVVGDDNAYKFLPVLQTSSSFVGDDVVEGKLITAFKTNTTISIYQDEAYVALERAETETQVSYSYNDVLYATEEIGKNEYDFTEAAVGATLKLEVLPEDCYVDPNNDGAAWATPVSVEVKVVDAFNVYTAKQLAIIENLDNNWDSIKAEMGITADMVASVKGVVLQNDISITASDIPTAFTYTIDGEIIYHTETDGEKLEKTAQEWGLTNTFLKEADGAAFHGVYERSIAAGQSFNVYGNYYLLDYSKLPLVSSLKTEDGNNYEDGYGSDYSNATLLKFAGTSDSKETVTISDLDSIGNANRSQLLDAKERPVYAGGSIFMKAEQIDVSLDNVINKTSFIGFLPEFGSNISMNNVKCFDSYQSVFHVWGSAVSVTNSTMERSGGPLFILQHVKRDSVDYVPTATVDAASKLNNPVTGEEAWFHSVGATTMVGQIKALSQIFMQSGKALTDNGASGKLNVLAIVMREGAGTEVLTDTTAQGYFAYGDYVINRLADATVNPLRQVYDMPVAARRCCKPVRQFSTRPIKQSVICPTLRALPL